MESRNVEIYRAGHEAFNPRDFGAIRKQYADSIAWTDTPLVPILPVLPTAWRDP